MKTKDDFNVAIACVAIAWDTDGDDADALDLPNSVVIENPTDEMIADCDEYNDAITDYLSDKYGFCIEGCHIYKCRRVNVMDRKTEKDFDIQVIQSTNPIPTSMQLLVNREHLVVYRQTDCDKLGEFAYRFDVYPSDDGVDCDKIVSAIVRKMVSQSYDHGAQWRETRRYRINKERMSPVSIVVQFYVRDAG